MEGKIQKMISLNGTNYHIWKNKMKDLLFVMKLHLPVFSTQKPADKTDEEWEFEHEQVCGFIRQFVEDNVYNHICSETHARTLWDKLEQLYASKTGNNKLFYLTKLMQLKYREGNSLADHLNEFQGIVDQLSGMGIKYDDEVLALMVLASLPESWETLKISLTNSAPNGVVTMELVKSGVLNEEMRRRSQGTTSSHSSQSDVLAATTRGRNQNRGPKSRDKSRGKSNKYANVECHYCHKKGHIKKFCRKLKKEKKDGKREDSNDSSDDDTTAVVADSFFILLENNLVNLAQHEINWVIDSGASIHATSHKEFFTSYTPGDYGVVKTSNNGTAKVIGVGDVSLETCAGTNLILKDVRHVPDIQLNLISTGKLDDEGFCNTFNNGQWKLTKGSLVVARGNKCSSLYLMQAKLSKSMVNAIENENTVELWHRRLGHMSEKGMSILARKKALSEVENVHLKKCPHCLAGKQHRVSFKDSPPSRKKDLLELVHSDVCGPMKTRSLGGASYFVTFVDDHSRKIWVYPLKTKDQVLDVFKQFQASVERQTGKKLKSVRSDNGGEYTGPFDDYCKSQGIRHQTTPPKTPQLNGVAERMNRTLMERVRCLLSHAKLPKTFWGEALKTVVYILNRSPCVALQQEVPEKVWSGKDVSYNHLRVFGCKAFVHIPKDERSKLDVKTRQCVFIGYGEDNLGYRFYDPVSKKLIRSRDIVFVENQTIEDIGEVSKSDGKSIDSDAVPPITVPRQVGDEAQNNQQGTDEDDAPTQNEPDGDDVHDQPPETQVAPIPIRRSSRARQPSTRYSPDEYVLLTDGGEPESFDEAIENEDKEKWIEAMQDEMKSLH